MERRDLGEVVDRLLDLVVDPDGRDEPVSAMDDAVTDGVRALEAVDRTSGVAVDEV